MPKYKPTQEDKDTAQQILDAFFTTGDAAGAGGTDINATDDIGECQPLRDLIDAIVEPNKKHPLTARFPFDVYEPFDENKDVHDFKIRVFLKERKNVDNAMNEYKPLFALGDCSRSFHEFASRYFATTKIGALKPADLDIYKYQGPSVSAMMAWYITSLEKNDSTVQMIDKEVYGHFGSLVKKWKDLQVQIKAAEKAGMNQVPVKAGGKPPTFPMVTITGTGVTFSPAGGAVPSTPSGTSGKSTTDEKSKSDASKEKDSKSKEAKDKSKADKDKEKKDKIETTFQCPLSGPVHQTSPYLENGRKDVSPTHPSYGGPHPAHDLVLANGGGAATKGTPVYSVFGGTVVYAGNAKSDPKALYVAIDHDGKYEGWNTVYYHLDKVQCKVGDKVTRGQQIGLAGNTGTTSIGAHLHFQVSYKGVTKDPTGMYPTQPNGPVTGIPETKDSTYKGLQYTLVPNSDSNVAKFKSLLEETKTFMEKELLDRAMILITNQAFKLMVNDLTGKVENLSISHRPGTSVYIPIAGEPAPVVQSTGGRIVQVSLKLKLTSHVDVARLMSMFRTVGKDDTVLSMLLVSRTIYNAMASNGGSRMVYETILEHGEENRLRDMLTALNGKPLVARIFDEPVMIENDILNALGMKHFVPYSMELTTVPDLANAYEVVLVLNYSNIGARFTETLRKEKGGQQAPIIPLAVRIGSTDKSIDAANGAKDEKMPEEAKFEFIKAVALGSMQYGLSEFLQLYVLYRIYNIKRRIDEIIADAQQKDGQDATAHIPMDDFSMLTILSSQKSLTESFGLAREKFNDVGALSNRLTSKPVIPSDSWWVRVGKEAPMGGIPLGGSIAMLSGASRAATGRGGLVGLTIGGVVAAGTSILGGVAQAYEKIGGDSFADKTPEAADRCLNFNIMVLIPYMMFELIREYLQAAYVGKTDKFIEDVVEGASMFFQHSETIFRSGNPNTPARMISFAKDIVVDLEGGSKQKLASGMLVTAYVGSVNDTTHATVSIPFKPEGILPIDMDTGLNKLEKDILARSTAIIDDAKKGQAQSKPPLAGFEISHAVNTLQYWSVHSILCAAKIHKTFGDNGIGLGNLEITTGYLLTSKGGRAHAKSLIQALITSSFIDAQAAYTVTNADGRALKSYADKLQAMKNKANPTPTDRLIEGQLTGVLTDIHQARRMTKGGDYPPQLVSGMFIDETLPQTIRKGLCQAALLFLGSVEHAAHYGELPALTTARVITESVIGAGPIMSVQDFTPIDKSKITSCQEIVEILDPNALVFALQWINMIKNKIFSVVWRLAVNLLLMVGEFFSGQWWALVLHIASIVIGVLDAASFLFDLFRKKVVEAASGYAHFFILSYWFAGRLYDGVDTATLVELCYKTDIWMPAALSYNSDACDERDTSYLDYPIVEANGKPMPPDFFIYKIGFLGSSMQELQDLMETVVGDIDSRVPESSEENAEWKDLAKKISDRTGGMLTDLITETRDRLTKYIFPESVGMDNTISSALFPANGTYDFAKYAALGELIETLVYGSEPVPSGIKFCYTRITAPDGKVYRRQDVADSQVKFCAVIIEMDFVNGEPRLDLRINSNMFAIAARSQGFKNSAVEGVDGVIRSNVKYLSGKRPKLDSRAEDIVTVSTIVLMDYLTQVHELDIGVMKEFNEKMPHTLGNLMVAKALVGSGMGSVGAPGLALIRKEVKSIGIDSLRRAVAFRSGYVYPTVKLFIIEEDDEAWYMFDDLYGYAGIASVVVHMDRTSPVQTAIVKVTNIHGKLSNVLSDKVNKDMHFLKAPDGMSNLNSIMLRTGCKIKIQAGNSPILTEDNTIFSGRVSNIDFGDITTIEAQSGGDALTEPISENKLKEYGYASTITTSVVDDVVESLGKRSKARLSKTIGDGYLRPITRVRDIASQILLELTQRVDTISDFTPVPEENTNATQIEAAYTDFVDMVRGVYAKHIGNTSLSSAGLTGIQLMTNKQMLENVRIRGERYWGIHSNPKEGCWLTFNETAWDNIQELNLLLPNNITTVRPFNTRSTFVWTSEDGYYRMRRSVDLKCLFANQLINKLDMYAETDYSRACIVFTMINGQLQHPYQEVRGAGLAMMTLAAMYAQQIFQAAGNPIDQDDLISINTTDGVSAACRWLGGNSESIIPEDLMDLSFNCMEALNEAVQSRVDLNTEQLGGISMTDIGKQISSGAYSRYSYITRMNTASVSDAKAHMATKGLCLEMACEILMQYFLNVAYQSSTSHRRVCDTFVKVNGRDIVKNEITVAKPFNTVLLSYPKSDESIAGIVKGISEVGFAEKIELDEIPIQAHYQLHSWAKNIYRTYYRNINVFRNCRNSTIAMVSANILNNLLRETYQGSITLLGDPYIRENDKILLWDETRDIFGMVRVKSHTFMFDPQQGCLSVIVPEMMVRSDYQISSTLWDATFNRVLWWLGAAAIAYGAYKGVQIYRASRIALKAKANLSDSKLAKMVDGTIDFITSIPRGKVTRLVGRFDQLRASWGLPPRKSILIDEYNAAMKTYGKEIREAAKTAVKGRAKIEKTIVNETMVNEITDAMNNVFKGQGGLSEISPKQVEKMLHDAIKYSFDQRNAKAKGKLVDHMLDYLDETVTKKVGAGRVGKWARGLGNEKGAKSRQEYEKGVDDLKKLIKNHLKPKTNKKGKVPADKDIEAIFNKAQKDYASKLQKVPKRTQQIADKLTDSLMSQRSIIQILKDVAKAYTIYFGADWAIKSVRSFGETILVNQKTADNLIIAPVFFRGEPMVAGLDGMNKTFAKDVSYWNVLSARFSDLTEAVKHAATDDIQQLLWEANIELQSDWEATDGATSAEYFEAFAKGKEN